MRHEIPNHINDIKKQYYQPKILQQQPKYPLESNLLKNRKTD